MLEYMQTSSRGTHLFAGILRWWLQMDELLEYVGRVQQRMRRRLRLGGSKDDHPAGVRSRRPRGRPKQREKELRDVAGVERVCMLRNRDEHRGGEGRV